MLQICITIELELVFSANNFDGHMDNFRDQFQI